MSSFDFIDVMERIATVIEKRTGTYPYDKGIAKELGISAPQYANNKKRNNIPYKNVVDFCRDNEITINWILFEQSSPLLSQHDEEIFRIKRLREINASAGGGAINNSSEEEYICLDKNSANYLGIYNNKHIEAINIIGDSMSPTLKDNSIILIDKEKKDIANSGIFVVNTLSGTFVKRLTPNPNGGLDLISDNKNYPVVTIAIDEIQVVGKVVGSLEKF